MKVILLAVEIMRKCFGGTQIEILDTNMLRKYPNRFVPMGYLGVSILIYCFDNKYNVFLRYQEAEDIVENYQNLDLRFMNMEEARMSYANDYIFRIIKDDFKRYERKLKLQKINECNLDTGNG